MKYVPADDLYVLIVDVMTKSMRILKSDKNPDGKVLDYYGFAHFMFRLQERTSEMAVEIENERVH